MGSDGEVERTGGHAPAFNDVTDATQSRGGAGTITCSHFGSRLALTARVFPAFVLLPPPPVG